MPKIQTMDSNIQNYAQNLSMCHKQHAMFTGIDNNIPVVYSHEVTQVVDQQPNPTYKAEVHVAVLQPPTNPNLPTVQQVNNNAPAPNSQMMDKVQNPMDSIVGDGSSAVADLPPHGDDYTNAAPVNPDIEVTGQQNPMYTSYGYLSKCKKQHPFADDKGRGFGD